MFSKALNSIIKKFLNFLSPCRTAVVPKLFLYSRSMPFIERYILDLLCIFPCLLRFIYASNLVTYCKAKQHVLKAALLIGKYFILDLFEVTIVYLFFNHGHMLY